MNKNKVITLLVLLFLVVALPVGLLLVQNRQDYKKGAAGNGAVKASLLPSTRTNLNPGDTFTITVNLTNTTSSDKLTRGVSAFLQYDPAFFTIDGIGGDLNPCNSPNFPLPASTRIYGANNEKIELSCYRSATSGAITLSPNVAKALATFTVTVKATAPNNQNTFISFTNLQVPQDVDNIDLAGGMEMGTYTVGVADAGTPTTETTITPTAVATPTTGPATGAYFRLTPAGHVNVDGQNIFKMEVFLNTDGKSTKSLKLSLKFNSAEFACAAAGVVDVVNLEANCNTGSDSYFVFSTKTNSTFSKVYNNEKIGEGWVKFQGSVQSGTISFDQTGLPNGTYVKDASTGRLITLTGMDDYVYTKGAVTATTSPTPTTGGSTSTPTTSPTPTVTGLPTATVTPTTPAGGGTVNLKVKMREVTTVGSYYTGKTLNFKVQLVKAGQATQVFNPVPVVVGTSTFVDGKWIISVSGFNQVAGIYDIYIKGPKHLQEKFPSVELTSATSQTKDLTTMGSRYYLEGGDLVRGTAGGQDGVVNSMDAVYLVNCFATMEDPVCIANADLTFDGVLNSQDMNLMNNTIYSKWEDDQQL